MQQRRPLTARQRANHHRLEEVVGRHRNAGVTVAVASGVLRPGAQERHIPGISTQVLHELEDLNEQHVPDAGPVVP